MKSNRSVSISHTDSVRIWTKLKLSFVMLGSVTASSDAEVTFYTSPGSFNSAAASYTLRGTETWATATSANTASVTDPLSPGVANGPFPNGSSTAVGVRVQSNSGGNNPANLAPGHGMFYAPAGFAGVSEMCSRRSNSAPTTQTTVSTSS